MSTVHVPDDFICPITGAVMKEPVMDREGNSYEKAAIEQWVTQGNSTSPITRNPLSLSDLILNRALKNSIEQFLSQHEGRELNLTARRSMASGDATLGTASASSGLPPQAPPKVKFIHDDQGNYLLSLQPPAAPTDVTTDSSARLPTDIVCVIDISGSMNSAATVQNEKNEVESHGLTVFNVVEHAAKTVSQLLGPNDRFALVTFNESSATPLGWTSMTPTGKKKVESTLKDISASGRTNLWGGLQTGMDLLKICANPTSREQRNRSILLLTDGQPNVEPPRGHIPTLKQYLDKLDPTTVAPFTVNTFGFGYSLDSTLLNDIAKETGGMYTFIPDSGLVGTVFVNTVANLLVTMTSNVTIGIEAPTAVKNSAQITPTNFGGFGSIGSLQYGQSRDQFFSVDFDGSKGAADRKLFAKVDMILNGEKVSLTAESTPMGDEISDHVALAAHKARWNFVSALTTVSRQELKARGLHLLKSRLSANQDKHSMIAALLADVEGQVALALNKDEYYEKWGKHYIPSLARANVLQQCNNFKDKSVQLYGGALFSTVRDQGEQTFLKLPPPAPKANASPLYGRRSSNVTTTTARPAAPTSMQGYWNTSGGCISGDSLVKMQHGELKKASTISRGDILESGARVECRVQIPLKAGSDLVRFTSAGLSVTPYHPIQQISLNDDAAQQWRFPIDCAPSNGVNIVRTEIDADVFSFLLEDHNKTPPCVEVGDIRVVTFAHGLKTDSVVAHDYFGSKNIRQDLERLHGYCTEGVVTVSRWIRNPENQHVVGLE